MIPKKQAWPSSAIHSSCAAFCPRHPVMEKSKLRRAARWDIEIFLYEYVLSDCLELSTQTIPFPYILTEDCVLASWVRDIFSLSSPSVTSNRSILEEYPLIKSIRNWHRVISKLTICTIYKSLRHMCWCYGTALRYSSNAARSCANKEFCIWPCGDLVIEQLHASSGAFVDWARRSCWRDS